MTAYRPTVPPGASAMTSKSKPVVVAVSRPAPLSLRANSSATWPSVNAPDTRCPALLCLEFQAPRSIAQHVKTFNRTALIRPPD